MDYTRTRGPARRRRQTSAQGLRRSKTSALVCLCGAAARICRAAALHLFRRKGTQQGRNRDATGTQRGRNSDATGTFRRKGTQQGRNRVATGTQQGRNGAATGTQQGRNRAATGPQQVHNRDATDTQQGRKGPTTADTIATSNGKRH